MPFPKGVSGNPAGRPRGKPNHVTREIREMSLKLFDDEYWRRTRERLREGTLAPAIESKLLAYAYGEPKQFKTVDTGVTVRIGYIGASYEPPTIDVVPVKHDNQRALVASFAIDGVEE